MADEPTKLAPVTPPPQPKPVPQWTPEKPRPWYLWLGLAAILLGVALVVGLLAMIVFFLLVSGW